MNLTKTERRILEILDKDDEADGDLVYERGAGWWIGNHHTNGIAPVRLLQLCLIKPTQDSREGYFERYEITSEGREVLRNPNYKPQILAEMRKMRLMRP